MSALRSYLTALVLAVTGLAGCQSDPYAVVHRPNSNIDAEAGPPADSGPPSEVGVSGDGDLRIYMDSCIADPNGEVCDELDNDCNGKVDDVPASKLGDDAKNCGKCGNACSFPNAFAKCVNAKCEIDDCAPGYHDLDPDEPGCEYACLPTNAGVEICDGVDNNCDGVIDDGFDLTTDLDNCGKCGNVCSQENTTNSCVAGKCKVVSCDDGWANLNPDQEDGCEYHCPKWPTVTPDDCNGIDDDCDGLIDEDYQDTSPCYNFASGCDLGTGQCKGECKIGTSSCINGLLTCAGEVGPGPESCDEKDNDCDGTIDNGFKKQDDPRYCGGCTACQVPHAIAKCVAGKCEVAVCEQGYVDLYPNQPGCETQCTVTGVEICDGLDNDCNGKTDGQDTGMVPLGGNPCATTGACAGATVTCQGFDGWVCNYGPDVERKKCNGPADCGGLSCTGGLCPGILAADETRCDGKDNNCNGQVDETFPDKGKPCTDTTKKGICQGSGTYVCDASGTATTCNFTKPGQSAKDELCNGLDDDCDGLVDETGDDAAGKGVKDAMVHIAKTYKSVAYDFYVYTYEASRPDANNSSAGTSLARACSKASTMPWANVTFAEADAACAAAGKRLCTATEWFLACSGAPSDPAGCTTTTGDGCYYPYGDAYGASNCNGKDFNATQDVAVATGSISACKTPAGIFDLSGNLKEWTDDPQWLSDPPTGDPDGYTVRGGGYDSPYSGMRCDFSFAVAPPIFSFPNLGFRCCSDSP